MQIQAKWSKPIRLADGAKHNLVYSISIDDIPESSGCYVFYNQHGQSITTLYIGKADNLKKRLDQQMNNLKLMMGIKKFQSGSKMLMYCLVNYKQGQNKKKVLSVLEKSLIKTALSNGSELLNKQGTRVQYVSIVFQGNRASEKISGRKISVVK